MASRAPPLPLAQPPGRLPLHQRLLQHLRLRPHRLPVLAALALVLVAHAWLLGSLASHQGTGEMANQPGLETGRSLAPVLRTRTITPAPAVAIAVAAAPPAAVLPAAPTVTPALRPVPPAVSPPLSPPLPPVPRTAVIERPAAPATSAPAEPATVEPLVTRVAATSSVTPAETPGVVSTVAEGAEVPTYRTRMPPAARLTYDLRRGVAHGIGELAWEPAEAAYTLGLQGRALGMLLIGWDSRGGFDAAGIAPERYVDSRRGRDAQAANFRRDSGRITFSGPAVELPLAPGTQDRLSWMLQLPAIVGAAPARFEPGAQVAMWVVGARGDMGVWTFSVEARETIDVPAGSVVGALRLKREPRKPYDTMVEVWLDPDRHHLPVKVRMSIPQTGDMTEFLLQKARFP